LAASGAACCTWTIAASLLYAGVTSLSTPYKPSRIRSNYREYKNTKHTEKLKLEYNKLMMTDKIHYKLQRQELQRIRELGRRTKPKERWYGASQVT
jgi:peptide methionine sulfoxide reductase MsrA